MHKLKKKISFLKAETELPHTQGTQGNSENFLIIENLRVTQGIFKIQKISGRLKEVLRFKKPQENFFSGTQNKIYQFQYLLKNF